MDELIGAIDRAVYDTIHDYVDPATGRRGATVLAPRCGMQPNTLSNKANVLQDRHRLSLSESVTVQTVTRDFRILYAYAQTLGHCAYRLPDLTDCSDIELLDAYTQYHEEIGLKASAIRRALQDGRVTPVEAADIRRLLDHTIRAGLGVIARLEALVK